MDLKWSVISRINFRLIIDVMQMAPNQTECVSFVEQLPLFLVEKSKRLFNRIDSGLAIALGIASKL